MPGPPPEPTRLKLAKGTRRDRVNKTEPEPPSALPVAPAWLPDAVRAVFLSTVAELDSMGLATRADTASLIALSQAVVEHQRASVLVAKQGILLIGERGQVVRNPAVVVTNQAAATIIRLSREFGLTPAARTSMGSKHEPEDKGSERLLA